MSEQTKLTDLKKILCDFFDKKKPTVTLAEYVGIKTNQIDLDGDVCSVWNEIIDEACKDRKLQKLVNEAVKRYPESLLKLNDTDWTTFQNPTVEPEIKIKKPCWLITLILKFISIFKKWLKELVFALLVSLSLTLINLDKIRDYIFPLTITTSGKILQKQDEKPLSGVVILLPEKFCIRKTIKTDENGFFTFTVKVRKSESTELVKLKIKLNEKLFEGEIYLGDPSYIKRL